MTELLPDKPTATDDDWMRLALAQAQLAQQVGEVPVGAVVVRHGVLIAQAHNRPVATHDPSAHAEMVALRAAAQVLGNYRLDDCELFVTLEPCVMCAGVMLHARLQRVVFGAPDLKTGAAGSVLNVFANKTINHHTQVQGGVLQQECRQVLRQFFSLQRQHHTRQRQTEGLALRDDALRTDAARFMDLPDLPATSGFAHDLPALQGLRMHYLCANPASARPVVLCLHGPADWSPVWRPLLEQAVTTGDCVLCPDLIGFGQSDKPKKEQWHTVQGHAFYLAQWLQRMQVQQVRVVLPAVMRPLGEALQQALPNVRVSLDPMEPAPLTQTMRQAPYPDNGHRAAMRAWARLLT